MRQHFYLMAFIIQGVILLPNNIKAQRLNDITNTMAQSLLKHGIDTVLIYRPYDCPATFKPTDTSVVEDISYIITNKDGLLTIERLTYEYPSNRGLILTHNFIFRNDTSGIFQYLHAHFKSIFSDTLLPGLIAYRINNKDTLLSTLGSHSCYTEIIIKTGTDSYSNGMLENDLFDGAIRNVDGSIQSHRESINYEYNTSTPIYKIISRLQLLEMDIKKTFLF